MTTFAKSKKRAVRLGSLVLLTFILTDMLIDFITHGIPSELFTGPWPGLQWWHVVIAGVVLLILLVLAVALAGFFIYQLNESHFGKTAVVRWAIFGIVLGLLFELLAPWKSANFLLNEVLDLVKGVLQFGLAYLIAFRLFPMKQPTPSSHS